MWYDTLGLTNMLLVLIAVLIIAILLELWRIEQNQKR